MSCSRGTAKLAGFVCEFQAFQDENVSLCSVLLDLGSCFRGSCLMTVILPIVVENSGLRETGLFTLVICRTIFRSISITYIFI